jgi:hypothetical protein
MITVKTTNTSENEYTHSPAPIVIIKNTFRAKENDTELIEKVSTWTITGILISGVETLVDNITALKTHYDIGELTAVSIVDGSTVLEELVSDVNIVVRECSFPKGAGPELATKREYTVVLEGIERSAELNTSGELTYTIEYRTDQSMQVTRVIKGSVKDILGSVYSKYVALKTSNGWSTLAGYNLIEDSYEVNDTGTLISFTIQHISYWVSFDSGITSGSKVTSASTDSMGVTRTRVSGWFEGTAVACSAAINAITVSSHILLTSDIGRDEFANRTNFTLEYISTTIQYIYISEELSVTSSIYDFVFKQVLGGAYPVKQFTSRTPGKASQTGEIRGLTTWPSAPAFYWSGSFLKSCTITKKSPEYLVSTGAYVYSLTYAYAFEFEVEPSF